MTPEETAKYSKTGKSTLYKLSMPSLRIHLRYIQEIPKDKSSKTKEIHTHASTQTLSAIKNF